jgi:ubiquinone/menaquinone biosynthesis C-methylase UbiE
MATAEQGVLTSSLPELYERLLVGPLFRPFAQELLDRTALSANARLLDVACGTGIVARLAQHTLGERGRVVGVDASPAMLAVARSVAPTIDWRQGDAARLPVADDETFDVVTCHQGLQFFPDKPSAMREVRRVLASGGRLAIGTWLPVDKVPLVRDLQRVAEQHLGPVFDQRHSFGDGDAITRLLVDAGSQDVRIATVARAVRIGGGPGMFGRLNTMAMVGMSAAGKSMTDEQRAHVIDVITNDSIEALRPYLDGDDLVFDLGSTVAVADLFF